MKALIVNDSLLERLSLGKMCAIAGFQVLEATSEDNLVAYIEREQIDLVICDSQLGEVDGLDICASVRAAKLDFFVYFLLLSSDSSQEFAIRALEAGADEHLPKPLSKPAFAAQMASVFKSVARQKSYYSKRADLPASLQNLYRDMREMSGFQRSRLPKRNSALYGLKLDYLWIPKVFVSGDLFDVQALDDQYVAFYILDVVGHGVPSALRVMDLSSLMSTNHKDGILLESLSGGYGHRVRRPAEVLGLMNQRFQMQPGNEVYFSMMYGLFNLHTGVVTVSMAGSPLPWVQDLQGNLIELGQPSFPIGVIEDDSYEDYSHKFEAGMRLFVCSDGLTQIRDAQDNELGIEGIAKLIEEGKQKTISQQIDTVKNGLSHWISGKSTDRLFEDDSTLLALQWRNQGDDDLIEEPQPELQSEGIAAEEVDFEAVEAEQVLEAPIAVDEKVPEFKFLPRKEQSTVLLWRDERSSTNIQTWLEEWGYLPEVVRARDACIKNCRATYYTFLLIDLQQLGPVDDKFFNEIREGLNPSIYVLLLSNAANQTGLVSALQAGADARTQAHYSPQEIYTRLNSGFRLAKIHRSFTHESESASELRADIEKDLKRIAEMQLENLPKPLDESSDIQFDLFFMPAGLLSNHYLNVITLPDGCIAFFHLTSEGQGLVGATRGLSLFRQLSGAAANRNSLLSQYMGDQFSPAAILRELNSLLLQEGSKRETCALCYGVLNPSTRTGRVAHAGYPLHILTRAKGSMEQLGAYGSSLGVSVDSQYQDVIFTYNPGDRLFVFPPELNSLLGLNGLKYDNVLQFFDATIAMQTADVVEGLKEVVQASGELTEHQSLLFFQLGSYVALPVETLSADDVARLCVELSTVLDEPVDALTASRIQIPNNSDVLPEVIENVEKLLAQQAIQSESLDSSPLVLFELTSNVCRHASLPQGVSFDLFVINQQGKVLFVVVDSGTEMPETLLSSAREHDYEFDIDVESEIPTGGLGLPLVHSLSSRFVYRRHGELNHAFAWFDLEGL